MPAVVKTVGDRGQIVLGERYAGQRVVVDEIADGRWTVQLGEFIPDDPVRFSDPEVLASIDGGLRWLAENPPAETDLDALERQLRK
jgi:hypothetical protein